MTVDSRVQRAVEDHALRRGAPEERVGVVFIHGIGQQPETATVREFGGALLDWLQEWHKARGLDLCVATSDLSYGERTAGPARFSLQIPASEGHPSQTWVLAEAWWAARLAAPDFVTMIKWSVRVTARVLVRLSRNVDDGMARVAHDERSFLKGLIVRVSGVFLLTGYMLALAALLPFIGALFVLAQLPGPFERLVLGLRTFLIEQIGDFYTFLYDDIQAVHIRRSVPFAIAFLLEELKCDRVLVAAHSHGTVVAYDALSSGIVKDVDRVKTLITFGAALNNAWDPHVAPARSCRIDEPLPEHMRWLNLWAAYDPVVGGPVIPPEPLRAPQNIEVTNRMNVLLDHGSYIANREEFLSRLAQEVDSPADHTRSRFWPGEKAALGWQRRHRDRVLALVGWRLFAMVAFGAAMLARLRPLDRLRADGEHLWAWLASVPVVGGAVTFIDEHLRWLDLAEPFGARILGTGFWLALMSAFYIVVTWLVFVRWHDAEGERSEGTDTPGPTQRPAIMVASAIVLTAITVAIKTVVDAGVLPGPS
ncbi:MAG TPA: hypothetical protein VGS01_15820 [Candidatus Limnocylindria bacterium]|nr:hypothetical protein [Candidatus Limnocylindria bacterium]